jgi:hypothetical protein
MRRVDFGPISETVYIDIILTELSKIVGPIGPSDKN